MRKLIFAASLATGLLLAGCAGAGPEVSGESSPRGDVETVNLSNEWAESHVTLSNGDTVRCVTFRSSHPAMSCDWAHVTPAR